MSILTVFLPSQLANLDFEAKVILALFVLCFLWILNTRDDEFVGLKNYINKCFTFINAIGFMIYSKDNKGIGPKYNPDPDLIKDKKLETKTLIFIRHGESDWNNVFNKGFGPSFFVRLITSIIEEIKILFHVDSKFLDSPLNDEGIDQAHDLSKFLSSKNFPEATDDMKRYYAMLSGEHIDNSVIVASSLRRAIATTTVGMWHRVHQSQEKILILSSLQEISRNIDTQSLSAPGKIADLPFHRLMKYCHTPDGGFDPAKVYDLSENFGNKTRKFYGIKRLQAFSQWVFARKEETIIVGGHSLWFKCFFQTFLPHGVEHNAKNMKLTNSGVVALTIGKYVDEKGTAYYRVEPKSIVTLYGGYTNK